MYKILLSFAFLFVLLSSVGFASGVWVYEYGDFGTSTNTCPTEGTSCPVVGSSLFCQFVPPGGIPQTVSARCEATGDPGPTPIIPTVSATEASDSWFNTQRVATISATNAVHIRGSWSNNLDAGCTTGGEEFGPGNQLASPSGGATLYLCARSSTGNVATWSGNYRWENIPPTCGTWSPSSSPLKVFGSIQTFTLSGSTDSGGSGIQNSGGSCTTGTVNGATCTVTISDNAGNTRTCTSPPNAVCQEGQIVENGACVDPAPTSFTLSVTVEGEGYVNSTITGFEEIDCGSVCTTQVLAGWQIRLFPFADIGHRFVEFEGVTCEDTFSNTCLLTMDQSRTVTARFEPIQCGENEILIGNDCLPSTCGDGIIYEYAGQICDFGFGKNTGTYFSLDSQSYQIPNAPQYELNPQNVTQTLYACDACQDSIEKVVPVPHCGDGIIQYWAGEECDGGDWCTDDCRFKEDFRPPSFCEITNIQCQVNDGGWDQCDQAFFGDTITQIRVQHDSSLPLQSVQIGMQRNDQPLTVFGDSNFATIDVTDSLQGNWYGIETNILINGSGRHTISTQNCRTVDTACFVQLPSDTSQWIFPFGNYFSTTQVDSLTLVNETCCTIGENASSIQILG